MLFLEHFKRLGELMQTLATTGYEAHRHAPVNKKARTPRAEFLTGVFDAVAAVLAPDEDRLRCSAAEASRMLLSVVMGLRFELEHEEDERAAVRRRVDLLLHGAITT